MNRHPQPASESSPSGKLRVLILGPLRLLLQVEEVSIPFPAGGSQEVFWASLLEQFPRLHGNLGAVRLARNHEFLLPEDKLEQGDEVALIPPVSGG